MLNQPIQSNFLGDVLNESSRLSSLFKGERIHKPEPELPPPPAPEPPPTSQVQSTSFFGESLAESDERHPLSADQLRSMARRKARTWGACLNMAFFLIEVFNSWGMVKKDDERLIEDCERVGDTDNAEYIAAKKRVSDFELFLEEAQKNSQLDEIEIETLEEALLAELKWKNKRGELDSEGVSTIIAGLFISRLFKKAGSFSKSFWKKIAVR